MTEPIKQFTITLAQLNPTVGDIDGNAAKARAARVRAQADGADLLVLPELFITGYPPEDLVLKPAFQAGCRAAIETLARETADGGPAVTTRCSGCGRSPPTGGIERSRDGHGISSQSNSRQGLLLYRRGAWERAIALALPTSCAGWRLGDQTPDALRWQRCRRLSSRATASAARRSDEAPGCLPARRGAQASLALGRRAP